MRRRPGHSFPPCVSEKGYPPSLDSEAAFFKPHFWQRLLLTDEGGFWATCLEVPGANGRGETKEECLENLKESIQLLLETEREEVFRLDPKAETAELLLA